MREYLVGLRGYDKFNDRHHSHVARIRAESPEEAARIGAEDWNYEARWVSYLPNPPSTDQPHSHYAPKAVRVIAKTEPITYELKGRLE